ncbi:YchJ family protein [Arthrobacter sulfonylureivorans]|uniref:YchJ family protein n=1 Tax=Arthrobacter sulfonylureivorans TaxID=2486855 RepID=UPI0039E358AF
MKTLPVDAVCPCQSGKAYGQCCRPFHRGDADAPTAEALMRSRYTAFVAGDVDYLLRTWHPETRPATLELDPGLAWTGLEILRTVRGGEADRAGTVEFRASYREDGQDRAQQEKSTFVREDGRWVYRDALSQS